ncbi:MAG: hypothetical protein AAFR21_04515 [Pseudomonadota bacterium]
MASDLVIFRFLIFIIAEGNFHKSYTTVCTNRDKDTRRVSRAGMDWYHGRCQRQ